jgi:hypothetical protein
MGGTRTRGSSGGGNWAAGQPLVGGSAACSRETSQCLLHRGSFIPVKVLFSYISHKGLLGTAGDGWGRLGTAGDGWGRLGMLGTAGDRDL